MEAKALYRPVLNGQADGNPFSSQYAVYIKYISGSIIQAFLQWNVCMNTYMHILGITTDIFLRDYERTAFDKFLNIAP